MTDFPPQYDTPDAVPPCDERTPPTYSTPYGFCQLPVDHTGPHEDEHGQTWEDDPGLDGLLVRGGR